MDVTEIGAGHPVPWQLKF